MTDNEIAELRQHALHFSLQLPKNQNVDVEQVLEDAKKIFDWLQKPWEANEPPNHPDEDRAGVIIYQITPDLSKGFRNRRYNSL
jgi:hypothetical protein